MSVDVQHDFREVMARVATPVSIVTVLDQSGEPRGCTVSAFTSLSMDPPMVLVSLLKSSTVLEAITAVGRFGLNVLGSEHSALAATFARRLTATEKFDGIEWQSERDAPKLPGALGWVACDVDRFVDGGDHTVVLGHVRAASMLEGTPLTYHLRRFGTHVVFEA